MKRILSILHWLNADTALGAVVTSLFIGQQLAAVMPAAALTALFLSVLAIYNFDHLLDAQRIKHSALSGRHRFYQENFKRLSAYQVVLLLALLVTSWFVPASIAQLGVILAVITLIYFILLFILLPKKFLLKEVFISLVYVAGLLLIPLIMAGHRPATPDYILWAELFLLAFSNTIILAWFDYSLDAREGHASLSQSVGEKTSYRLGYGLLLLLLALVLVSLLLFRNWHSQLVILAMGLLLGFTLIFHTFFRQKEAYRFTIDAIFLIPVLTLFTYA